MVKGYSVYQINAAQSLGLGVVTTYNSFGEFTVYYDAEIWEPIPPKKIEDHALFPNVSNPPIGVIYGNGDFQNFVQAEAVTKMSIRPIFTNTWNRKPIQQTLEQALF